MKTSGMGNMMGGGMQNFNQFEQTNTKKTPNPNNYKIVKCKNYESSIYKVIISFKLVIANMVTHVPSLMVIQK